MASSLFKLGIDAPKRGQVKTIHAIYEAMECDQP